MNGGWLFDSNIIIYRLNDRLSPAAELVVSRFLEGQVYVSVISRIEILGWRGHTDESRTMTETLLSYFTEISLNEPIVQATISIRRNNAIRLPDAIIAASALSLGLPLVTRNVQDFEKVEELTLINPFER